MKSELTVFIQQLERLSINELLDQIEIDYSKVGQADQTRSVKMLLRLDMAAARISALASQNVPIKAEQSQFEYILTSLKNHSKGFLKDIGGSRQLQTLRSEFLPEEGQIWWFLDKVNQQQNRMALQKTFTTSGLSILAILLFVLIYQNFLAPSPEASLKYARQLNAEQAMSRKDYGKALEFLDAAVTVDPLDSGLLVIVRGVVLSQLEQKQAANDDFSTAERVMGSRVDFLITRAQAWLTIQQTDFAMQDAQEVLQTNPNNAEALFMFGKANELSNKYSVAIDAYNKASDLAAAQGKAELNGVIRVSLAMLMQTLPIDNPTPTVQPAR